MSASFYNSKLVNALRVLTFELKSKPDLLLGHLLELIFLSDYDEDLLHFGVRGLQEKVVVLLLLGLICFVLQFLKKAHVKSLEGLLFKINSG